MSMLNSVSQVATIIASVVTTGKVLMEIVKPLVLEKLAQRKAAVEANEPPPDDTNWDEILKQIEGLEKTLNALGDPTKLIPEYPMEATVLSPQIVILYFEKDITQDSYAEIEQAMEEDDSISLIALNTIICSKNSISFSLLGGGGDRETIDTELVTPAAAVLAEFGIEVRSVLYI